MWFDNSRVKEIVKTMRAHVCDFREAGTQLQWCIDCGALKYPTGVVQTTHNRLAQEAAE